MTLQLEFPTATESRFICTICQAPQEALEGEDAWRCRHCGQPYKGRSLDLSEQQLTALRTLAGRDASGRATLITNWWTEHNQPVGENFLTWNKNSPARDHTRGLIKQWVEAREIQSILEVAFGGLHEYRALRQFLKENNITYGGVDWTAHFVAHAQGEFPENRWTQGDIVRGVAVEQADLIYSQHMLEHIPALEPAFSNMLRLARRRLLNIFFIPPKPFDGYEVVNWKQYPLYHNTYSLGHVDAVCHAMGFTTKWFGFGPETVLLAERAG